MTAPLAQSYRLVLPPAWGSLPVGPDSDRAVQELLDRSMADVPSSAPPDQVRAARRLVEGRLRSALAQAAQSGGRAVYLPVDRMHGLSIEASFIVSEIDLRETDPGTDVGAEEGEFPDQRAQARVLLALATSDDSSSIVEVAGAAAVRTERVVRPRADQPVEGEDGRSSYRVDYVFAIPGSSGRWASVSFSAMQTFDGDEDVTPLLVALFDALMTTWRWETEA